jgi:hypothetical protein
MEKGEKVSFVVAFNGMTINHDGVIGGGEIKLKNQLRPGRFSSGRHDA